MEPYFYFLLFLSACYFFDHFTSKDTYKILAFIGFAAFSGFRENVGIDYKSYVNIFNYTEGYFLHEPGSIFLIEALHKIKGTEHLYFLIMASITEVFVYKILIKERREFWLLVFMYYCVSIFYFASFNAVRNYAAIAIVIWSLKYVETGDFKRYTIIILATTFLFHYSAALFLLLYFYLRRNPSVKEILFTSAVVFLSGSLVSIILPYTPYAKYEALMSNDFRQDKNSVESIHFLFAFIAFMLILIGRKFSCLKKNPILFNMNSLSFFTILLVIYFSSGSFMMLFQRLNNYFLFSYLLIIPAILRSLSVNSRVPLRGLLLLFSFLYLIRTLVFKGEHHMLVPYDCNFTLFN